MEPDTKMVRNDHVLRIVGLELDALFFCFVQVLEKPIMALR